MRLVEILKTIACWKNGKRDEVEEPCVLNTHEPSILPEERRAFSLAVKIREALTCFPLRTVDAQSSDGSPVDNPNPPGCYQRVHVA
jgi:hypothetical protein